MQSISPEKLFLIIVTGVAVGIGLSPFIGTIAAVIGAIILLVIGFMIFLKTSKIAFNYLLKVPGWIQSEVKIYSRSAHNAWVMLTSKQASKISTRLDGLFVLITLVVWVIFVALIIAILAK